MERTERQHRVAAAATAIDTEAIGHALRSLSDADLVRLRALARLWSRGLPGGLAWTDILNEAIVRCLDGSRSWPSGVPLLAFLSGVMRSICDEHWRRARRDHQWRLANPSSDELAAGPVDPERMLASAQALGAINGLFADDPAALKIIAGLTEGLAASDIRGRYDMSEREYDSARKRMRRALLRRGLVRETP